MIEDQAAREMVCEGARQLWMRGLIAGDGGMVAMETHRRRFVTTPPGSRRCDLKPQDLILVDMGGLDINGRPVLPEEVWRPHRVAFHGRHDGQKTQENPGGFAVRATALATPPAVTALSVIQADQRRLDLYGMAPLHVVESLDEKTLREALEARTAVVLPTIGLLALGPDVPSVLNLIEKIELAAVVELACLGRGPETLSLFGREDQEET